MTLIVQSPRTAQPHRAFRQLEWTRADTTSLVLLTIALTVGVAAALPWIAEVWRWSIQSLVSALALPSTGIVHASASIPGVPLVVEAPALPSPWPTTLQLTIGWGATALGVGATVWLYRRQMPLGVVLGFLTLVHFVAQTFFTISEPPFRLALGSYLVGFQRWGLLLIVLAPLLLSATFFVFPIPLWRKVAVSIGLIGHLGVLVPLQAALLAWLVTSASTLMLPLGAFLLGLPLDIIVYVAFFAWGMSGARPAVTTRSSRFT